MKTVVSKIFVLDGGVSRGALSYRTVGKNCSRCAQTHLLDLEGVRGVMIVRIVKIADVSQGTASDAAVRASTDY